MSLLARWEATAGVATETEGATPNRVPSWRDSIAGQTLTQSVSLERPVTVTDSRGNAGIGFAAGVELSMVLSPAVQAATTGPMTLVVVGAVDLKGKAPIVVLSSSTTDARVRMSTLKGAGLALNLTSGDGLDQDELLSLQRDDRVTHTWSVEWDNAGGLAVQVDDDADTSLGGAVVFGPNELDTITIGSDPDDVDDFVGRVLAVYLYSGALVTAEQSQLVGHMRGTFGISSNEKRLVAGAEGLSQQVLRFDADVGVNDVGGFAESWAMLSNGGTYVSQFILAQRPAVVSALGGTALRFDGGDNMPTDTASVSSINTTNLDGRDVTLTCVINIDPLGSGERIILDAPTANGGVQIRVTAGGALEFESQGLGGTGLLSVAGIPHGKDLACVARLGSDARVAINGIEFVVPAQVSELGPLGLNALGSLGSGIGGSQFQGDIADVAFSPGSVSDAIFASTMETLLSLHDIEPGISAWCASHFDGGLGLIGDPVTQWDDQSQPDSLLAAFGEEPALVTENGLGCPQFDGTVDALTAGATATAGAIDGLTEVSLFCVVNPTAAQANGDTIFEWLGAGGEMVRLSFRTGAATLRADVDPGIAVTRSMDGPTLGTGLTLIDARFGTLDGELRIDAVSVDTEAGTLAPIGPHTSVAIGEAGGGGGNFQGKVCEVGILPLSMDNITRAGLYSFLTAKWGL